MADSFHINALFDNLNTVYFWYTYTLVFSKGINDILTLQQERSFFCFI